MTVTNSYWKMSFREFGLLGIWMSIWLWQEWYVLCWVMRMVTANFLLMITVGLVCLNLYNALCSLEMIGITIFSSLTWMLDGNICMSYIKLWIFSLIFMKSGTGLHSLNVLIMKLLYSSKYKMRTFPDFLMWKMGLPLIMQKVKTGST